MASPIVQIKRNDSITALSSHIGLLPGELAFDYGNGILYIGAGTSSSTSDCIPINPINTVTLNAGAGLTGGGSYTNGHGIDATLSFALATSGVTAGSYGPSANATPGYGVTFNVPYITVDKYGRVTGASTKTVKIPASDNTNTSHTHTAGTGLTISGVGGTSGTTTYSVNLNSTISLGAIGTTSKLYAIGVDDNGQLCVNIPWSNTTYSVAKYNTLGLVKPAYTTTGAATLTTAAASNTATPTIQAKTTNSDRYYAVEADKNGYLFVNVPWANTNTDTKVTQTVTTSDASYPLLLAPAGQTATKTTTSYFDSGVILNPSTNTITANISGTAARATHADNGVYYVEGDVNGTAGVWTGTNTNIPSLYTGLTIAYKIGTAGHKDGTTLNLTIANNVTTGDITVYRNTGSTTTHLPVNTVVILTYDGTGWRWSDYDANSYAYVRQYSTSTNANYPLLFRYQVAEVSSGSYETKYVRFDSNSAIYANPSTGLLAATSFSGSGASLTNLNASNLSSGTVPVARLPVAAATTVGVVQGFHHTTGTATGTRTTNATNAPAINSRTTTENRYYGIETDSIGKMYVNVPWAAYTFENKGVTLAWGQTSTIATVGGTNITLTMPANPDTNTTYGVAKYNTLGLVKPAYTSTNSATLTTAAATNTTTPTIAAKSTTSGRYYAIEADKNGYMFVNVPWVNTNTTYSAGTGLSLSDTTFNHSNSVTAKTTYNQATASPGYGGTFKITEPKYDAQGHITGVQVATITMPSAQTIPTSLKNPYPLKAGTKSYDGSQAIEITAADLGLSSAMKFLGTSATAITDGATTNPITIGSTSTTVTNGNVVLYGSKEFVWIGSAWEELGNEGSYKIVQDAVASPTASGSTTAFIDTITQDANGKITATKKNVSFPNLSGGTAAAADAKVIGGVTVNGHAITAAQKTITGAGSVTVSGTATEITITGTNTTYGVAKYNTLGLVKPAYTSTGAATLTTTAATNTSTPTIAAKTTTAGRYYAVEADTNGILFVNVPWVDTNTTSIPDTSVTWSGTSMSGNISPIDTAASYLHSANRMQFAKPAGITIEYSTDSGSSWTDYGATDAQKTGLVSGIDQAFIIGKKTSANGAATDRLRISINATSAGFYTRARKMLINMTTNGAGGCKVLVERSMKGSATTFVTVGTYDISGWSGWNSIPLGGYSFGGGDSQTSNVAVFRFTFYCTSVSSSYNSRMTIINMNLIGETYWGYPSNMAKTGHIYSWDVSQNTTFPAAIISGSGTSDFSAGTLKFDTINIPTSSGGTTYGPGTNGYVLKSNGTTVYWGTDNNTTYTALKNPNALTLQVNGTNSIVYDGSAVKTWNLKAGSNITLSDSSGTVTITSAYPGAATASTLGLVKVSSVNTTAVTVNSESTTSGRYYPVEMNSDQKLIVNVPWVNTTYSLSGLGGIGTISASGTAPLTLSASKSGTTVTLTGSVATAGAASLGVVQGWHHTTGTATGTRVTNASNAPAIAARTTTSGRYYGVETDASGRMFVNVPWTNTDTNTAFPYLSGWADTRSTATTPNDYNAKLTVVGIKTPTASGITSDNGGSYSTLLGIRGWSDSSGGNSHELAFCGNGALYHRHGATTSWNAWDRVVTASTVSNKGVTLAWGTTSTVATIGGVDIKITMPANPDTNTNTNYYHTRVYSSGLKISTGTGVSDMYVPVGNGSQQGVTLVYPAASCTTYTSDSGAVTPAAVKKAVGLFVSVTPSLTSGTKIGSISINGTSTDLYCQTNTDTKNTAGSTNSTSKLFLIGATSQAVNPQTYSNSAVYATNGTLTATKYSVNSKVTLQYNTTTESLDFVFA